MLKFLEHRIADQRILRLIGKWLKAGVIENGVRVAATKGTPQGAVISPLLANIYLHYALDQWTQQWRQRHARGQVIAVRYADDSVFGFKSETTARQFLAAMQDRLAKFGLTLHAKKTRLIEFGRFAASTRKRRGQDKPETFDFLGFTHCCSTTRAGLFQVRRLTVKKRMRAKIAGNPCGTDAQKAPAYRCCGQMAEPGGAGLPELPRCAGQLVPTGEHVQGHWPRLAALLDAQKPAPENALE